MSFCNAEDAEVGAEVRRGVGVSYRKSEGVVGLW